MDNFKIIYRILKALEQSMDCEETNLDAISHTRLGVSRERWEQILILLAIEGYISGIIYTKSMSDSKPHIVEPIQPAILLKGLEYLADNTMMKKAARLAKGIAELVP